MKARNGSVLGKGSIIKMYFFPGQKTSNSMHIIGAPHVYKVFEKNILYTFICMNMNYEIHHAIDLDKKNSIGISNNQRYSLLETKPIASSLPKSLDNVCFGCF